MSRFTQTLKTHLNGGSKFSRLVHNVLCDGKPTNIVRLVTTNGSPKHLKTQDIFVCGEDVFDVLATKGKGLHDWLLAHISPEST